MAILDTTYYRGTDLYSDGDEEENRILETVRAGKTLRDLGRDEVSWPMLYHLSPVRENICNWFPFPADGRILEIGAGCGAITGALCRSGAEIVSVDLSLRRSTVNYERHKDCENLRLTVGNLNEIPFGEPFDIVVVNGVLEYAGKFTEGENPYRTFLQNIRKYLKPDGRMLLAIENRLGLKYFAGAEEDHLGKAYVGLRGYNPADGIRTFSRRELRTLLRESGFKAQRFYYPYPDYKFPLEIFTDESLGWGQYGKPYLVFDKDRTLLFPEEPVAKALAEDGAAGALSNSFLVEAGIGGLPEEEKILYAKLNADRKEEFRVGTRIIEAGGEKRVEKFALCDAAKAHLRMILENEQKLKGSYRVLEGKEENGKVVWPFVEQSQRFHADDQNGTGWKALRGMITDGATETAYMTPAFQRWFGDTKASREQMMCVCPANVDLMADNVFADGDGLIVTDCEWVTDFPVPADFLLWRALDRAGAGTTENFREFGIREEDLPTFRAWSRYFENEYAAPRNENRFSKDVIHSDLDLTGLIAEKKRLERENHELNQRLREILDSRSWRMMQIPRKAYRKIFPAGSAESETKEGQGKA